MYKVIFYQNAKGKNEVNNYIPELRKNNSKNNNIKLNKIISYLKMLELYELRLGEPYIKHINKGIWELRPLRDRILFAAFDNNKFIILTYFVKKTNKTPTREIIRAKKCFDEYIIRGDKNE